MNIGLEWKLFSYFLHQFTNMGDMMQVIEKYKARLNPDADFKKIFRALQKLNEMDMTIDLLQATGIGKAVNGLRKREGLGDFAKEIVNKWKKLIASAVVDSDQKSSDDYTPVKSEPVEYDPTQNWQTPKSPSSPSSSAYTPVKQEKRTQDEYEPWNDSGHDDDATNSYIPSSTKQKVEKDHSKQKKKKTRENGRVKEKEAKKKPKSSREAELLDMLRKTQEELGKMKKEKSKKTRVKEEKESPDRNPSFDPVNGDDIEEYDPQSNFEMDESLSYDPGSNSGYEPSSHGEDMEEYDPGPAQSSYKPQKMNSDAGSRVNGEDEDSYDEDEPGAYLLHPRRASSDRARTLSGNSVGSSITEDPEPSCMMSSTTLYTRNKSVDSEDGNWGSQGKGQKSRDDIRLPSIEENDDFLPTEKNNIKKSKQAKKEAKKDRSEKSKDYKHVGRDEKSKKSENHVKVKREKESNSGKNYKVTPKSSTSSSKRKSTSTKEEEPIKKKSKTLENVKSEKHKPQDAGFLFEDIPDVSKLKKKKKKKSSANHSQSTAGTSSAKLRLPKLDLHLPEIQTTYRPLPHPEKSSDRRSMELTDTQAAELHSTRQTKKMLVYSGGGGGFIPKMMSLYDQCMSVLMNNIDALDVIGGIPFEIIQPVLERCTSEQLYRLEDSNPYLLEDTDVLWEKHARSEFKGKRPAEMELWREMYLRLHDEREAKLRSLTQTIQAKEAKKKPLEKKVLLAYVGMTAKAPRNVRRAQEKYGTALKSKFSSRSSESSSAASAMRQEITQSRMSIPVGSITAASVERENRFSQARENKKPRVAPMMAKTLKSIGRLKYRR